MTRRILIRREFILIALLLLSACTEFGTYFPPPGSAGPGNSTPQRGNPSVVVTAGISVVDAKKLAAANNLTGLRTLPPGIRRNLQRGRPLPRGISRQVMPEAVLVELPRHPGHEWRIAGRDLVLIAVGTLIVVDILNDVFE